MARRHSSFDAPPRLQRTAPQWWRFAGSLGMLSATWLLLLPWIGRYPAVADHIEQQERQGIDPSAVFYSELEIVPPIAHRIERLQVTQRDAFWGADP